MRTTLTLDEDVAKLLQKEVRRTGEPFKQVVNDALRRGFTAPKKSERRRFVVEPRAMGLPPGLSYDNVGELLDALDDPERR